MSTGSLRLGRIAGIPVRAHWSIVLIAVLFGVNLVALLGVVGGLIAVVALPASIVRPRPLEPTDGSPAPGPSRRSRSVSSRPG